jgi:hypothetical protein
MPNVGMDRLLSIPLGAAVVALLECIQLHASKDMIGSAVIDKQADVCTQNQVFVPHGFLAHMSRLLKHFYI